jgi:uncharacterized protein YqhQ
VRAIETPKPCRDQDKNSHDAQSNREKKKKRPDVVRLIALGIISAVFGLQAGVFVNRCDVLDMRFGLR